jgi:preprotein translocase subunit SecF
MFDFAGKRWWYLSFSIVIFLIAVISLAIFHLKPGIEFTSGSTFTFQFTGREVTQSELHAALTDLGHGEARIQSTDSNEYLIRTSELEGTPPVTSSDDNSAGPQLPAQGEIDKIQEALCQKFGTVDSSGNCTGVVRKDFSTVSGTVSTQIARNATIAVMAACLAILIYISITFRGLQNSWRYGTAAVIAVAHDAFIVLGFFALLGETHGTEVDTGFITAILTVIGFSVHDTIVVFDRIREKIRHDRYVPFEEAVNASMTETLARSINTSLVVVLTVVTMLLIGGESIRNFLLVLLIGIVAGTYSSIAVASQVLVVWENRDIPRFFRKLRGGGKGAIVEPVS